MSEPIDLNARRQRTDGATFVCTACGSMLPSRGELEQHWTERPWCKDSLKRPSGNFGAPTPGTHCDGCHASMPNVTHENRVVPSEPCPTHAYRGCPGC